MSLKFDSNLLVELVHNAGKSAYLVRTADGKLSTPSQGVSGTIIMPEQAIKEMLFGDASDRDQLAKQLITALGGKLKAGRAAGTGTGRRGRPKKVK